MAGHTFHTPSFGDEDFDVLPTHLNHHQQIGQPLQTNDSLYSYESQVILNSDLHHSSGGLDLNDYNTNGEATLQSLDVGSAYNNQSNSYDTNNLAMHSQSNDQMMVLHHQQQQQQQQQQQHAQFTSPQHHHPQYMHSQQMDQPPQQQQQQQDAYKMMHENPVQQKSHSFENPTTSEDSDDGNSYSAMNINMKRISPEASKIIGKEIKKTKVSKKKKKKDPNEPQKPVSAYALFFRDTQAAIKSQNSNASFGEVSKIVASMWDALETEHKDVYKKKAEVAKKDYLKALAAYRASLVQKSGKEQQMAYSNYETDYPIGSSTSQSGYYDPQSVSPQHQQQQQQLSPMKKSVHQQMQYQHMQQKPMQPNPMSNQMAAPHMAQLHHVQDQQQVVQSHHHYMQQVNTVPQMDQQMQQQNQMMNQNSGGYETQMPNSMPTNNNQTNMPPPQQLPLNCIRQGCPNAAISNTEWEDEYCSNECVVSHCKDIFTNWVPTNQNPQQNFSTVK